MALESYMKDLIGPSSQVRIVNDNSTSNLTRNACLLLLDSDEDGDADTSSRHSRTAGQHHLPNSTSSALPTLTEGQGDGCPCMPVYSRNRTSGGAAGTRGGRERQDVVLEEFVERHRSICQSWSPGAFPPRSPNRRRVHKSPPPRQPLTPTTESDEDAAPGGLSLLKTRGKKEKAAGGMLWFSND